MDGSYWLAAVPDLQNFYIATQAAVTGDPRPEVAAVTEAFKAKYGAVPASQYAYPIYAFLQLWGRAVEKAGTTNGKEVTAVLESFKNEPTLLGPRNFSHDLHIQTQIPMLIEDVAGGQDKVVDKWSVSEAMPDEVLYRLKK